MNTTFRVFVYTLIIVLTFLSQTVFAVTQTTQRVGQVEVRLIAREMAARPGVPFDIGLQIIPDKDWHVYWINPGDAGLPPILTWDLPDGFTASDISFPAPDRIDVPPLTAYGYYGDVLYPVTIHPGNNIEPGSTFTLKVKADWLVCKEVCIPGTAVLELTMPVVNDEPKIDTTVAELFTKSENRTPIELPESYSIQTTLEGNSIYIDFSTEQSERTIQYVQFYCIDKNIIKYSSEQMLTKAGSDYRLQLTTSPYLTNKPDSLQGVLQISTDSATDFYNLRLPIGQQTQFQQISASSSSLDNILIAFLFAFIGGLILNLMPCVLPVLSLKVLGLVNQAAQGRRASFMHGISFTIGVLLTFWLIVAVMFMLQAGGTQLGWGFQLQSPAFVVILATGLFLFALSLFGLFEISFLTGVASSLSSKKTQGYSSSLVSGITATLLATPCTAPFMGAALGYSMTLPPLHAFFIYTFLALGMASPYLLLAIFPQFLAFVPKPGAWMETLKQVLGFMMAATIIWLGWVLVSQSGSLALIIMLVMLLFTSIAAWILGRWGSIASSPKSKIISKVLAALIILTSLFYGNQSIDKFRETPAMNSKESDGIMWKEFSPVLVKEMISQGRPVFIDFTAAWCLSCQVNEKISFSSSEVQEKFKSLGIVPIKADWTNRSDEIASALASYGRNSVPLYVLYSGKQNEQPVLLPEIITPGIVLKELSKLESDKTKQ